MSKELSTKLNIKLTKLEKEFEEILETGTPKQISKKASEVAEVRKELKDVIWFEKREQGRKRIESILSRRNG